MSTHPAPTPAGPATNPAASDGHERLVIVGASGFGREVNDIVVALRAAGSELELVGYLDDHLPDHSLLDALGVAFLGGVADWTAAATSGGSSDDSGGHVARPAADVRSGDVRYVVAISDHEVRHRIDRAMATSSLAASPLVHPAATVGAACRLGVGVIVAAGARLTTNITLRRHVHVHVNATVGHDAVLSDYVTVLPGATVGGATTVGPGATIGSGANVLQGVSIGASAFVGAGAVVVRDVAPGATVVGVPAHLLDRRG